MAITDININEFRTLFDLAKDIAGVGYWEWDIQTNEVLWSKQKIEIYGEDSETFIPSFEKFLAVVNEDTQARILKEIDSVLSGKKPYYDLEHKIKLKNGKVSWVHEKAFIIYSTDKQPLKLVGIVYDTTNNMRTLEKLKDSQEENSYTREHDQLTKLYNREALKQYISTLVTKRKKFNLLFLDIDNFKIFNNTFSHSFGDVLLQRFAVIIKKVFPLAHQTYRYASDEFVVVLEEDIDTQAKIENLQAQLLKAFIIQNHKIKIDISIGVSCFPENSRTEVECITNANSALKIAKSIGKNTVLFYEPYMSEEIAKKHTLLESLKEAISNEDIIPFYQPKVDTITDKTIGFEALARWNSNGKIIAPFIFIDLAIENHLINDITFLMLKQALKQLQEWHNEGYEISLSVNFTNGDYNSPSILQLLKEYTPYLPFLTIEVVENELIQLNEGNFKDLENLKSLGIKLALDDFGTGYSSLQYLHQLPIDELKIDKSFVDRIPGHKKDEDLVKIIHSIINTFDLKCIVEGVETKIQRDYFLNLGLHTVQGYLYSKPLSAKDATVFLKGS